MKPIPISHTNGRFFLVKEEYMAGERIIPNGQVGLEPNLTRKKPSTMIMRRLLDQRGPFAIRDMAPGSPTTDAKTIFTQQWFSETTPEDRTIDRMVKTQLRLLFGISSFAELQTIAAEDPEKREERSNDWYRRIGKQYGIEGDVPVIKDQVKHYATTADKVIEYLQQNVLNGQAARTEITNEILHTSNPLELTLMMFDTEHYSKRARFEAKRKLALMVLAATVEQVHQSIDPVEKLKEFDDFLNRRVWRPGKIGEAETVHILSTHDPETFECKTVEFIDQETAREKEKTRNAREELVTTLGRRYFTYHGEAIPVYITTRPKNPETKILKMLRKDTDNPSVAVEDDLGIMGVFDTVAHVDAFQEVLQKGLVEEGFLGGIRDVSDTLEGGEYLNGNAGSSTKTRMRKGLIDFPEHTIEVILHTHQTYLDYYKSHDVGHDEFITKRLYSTGVVDLLFPSNLFDEHGIYAIDHQSAQEKRIEQIRSQLSW
ncbi:MAG TPA: hypothetical protein VLF20_01535 [Patescibacteria group bacterium]|nr:hypothetical protein [Patescibacteria group bacterium]